MNFQTYQELELYLYSGLYCEAYNLLTDKTAFELLEQKLCGINGDRQDTINFKTNTKFRILKLDSPYLVLMLSVYDKIHFVTVGNSLEAIILNVDKFDINKLAYDLTLVRDLKYKNTIINHWKNYLEIACKQIRSVGTKNWSEINIPEYKINFSNKPIKIYGRKFNNEVLIGFNVYETNYNCFTGNLTINVKDTPNVIDCDIMINDKIYNISGKDRYEAILKLYVNLCNDNKRYKLHNIHNIKKDSFRILSSKRENGISAILFKKEYADKIFIRKNNNERVSIVNMIPKLKMLDTNEVSTNMYFYDHIPLYFNAGSYNNINYDYTLSFIKVP